MSNDFMIDDMQLSQFISELTGANRRVASASAKWVRRLTNYTHKKMRSFAKSRSPRSTGRLSSSITSKYTLTNQNVEGIVYVPPEIKYQFAAEEGIQKRTPIKGRPLMTFGVDAWKKARRSIVAEPNRGYYVFAQVLRGRYKGKHFTQRAFDSLNSYYNSNQQKIMDEVGDSVIFSR